MKYITIATDISCDYKNKISTWACYIRHNGGVIKEFGQFKEYPKSTASAETYALVNALTIASKNIKDWHESRIVIHNEIDYALSPIRTKAGNIKRKDDERAKAIIDIAIPILESAVDWDFRKIKAHYKDWKQSDNPAKYAINRWCDKTANEAMRELRRRKKSL